MPNTKSAEKAIRSSEKKNKHNLFWKENIRKSVKNLKKLLEDKNTDPKALSESLVSLQKSLDKATKEKVIHKNKANRLKSKYAQRISAHRPIKKSAGANKPESSKSTNK